MLSQQIFDDKAKNCDLLLTKFLFCIYSSFLNDKSESFNFNSSTNKNICLQDLKLDDTMLTSIILAQHTIYKSNLLPRYQEIWIREIYDYYLIYCNNM